MVNHQPNDVMNSPIKERDIPDDQSEYSNTENQEDTESSSDEDEDYQPSNLFTRIKKNLCPEVYWIQETAIEEEKMCEIQRDKEKIIQ